MSRSANKLISAALALAGTPFMLTRCSRSRAYEGNSSSTSMDNGIDLSGDGTLWFGFKRAVVRSLLTDGRRRYWWRGISITANWGVADERYKGLTAFNSGGGGVVANGNFDKGTKTRKTLFFWTFRKQPGFFDVVTYTVMAQQK